MLEVWVPLVAWWGLGRKVDRDYTPLAILLLGAHIPSNTCTWSSMFCDTSHMLLSSCFSVILHHCTTFPPALHAGRSKFLYHSRRLAKSSQVWKWCICNFQAAFLFENINSILVTLKGQSSGECQYCNFTGLVWCRCARCQWTAKEDGYDDDSKPLPKYAAKYRQFTDLIKAGRTAEWQPWIVTTEDPSIFSIDLKKFVASSGALYWLFMGFDPLPLSCQLPAIEFACQLNAS